MVVEGGHRRLVVVEGGSLEPAAWPREWMMWMASSASPPSVVSATMGMQSIPASRHAREVGGKLALYPHYLNIKWPIHFYEDTD